MGRIRAGLVAALALAFGLCLSGSAAALTIDVTGVAGSGTTVWEFSGTSPAGALPGSAQGEGFFTLANDNGFTALNNWSSLSGSLGTINASFALGPGATVSGSVSGTHGLDGVGLLGLSNQFRWHADGAFPGSETMTYAGSATSSLEITQILGIAGPGDSVTFTSSSGPGGLTINFTAVPEPSTALLVGIGLLGLAARECRRKA